MAWVYLMVAGVFEVGFTTCMKFSNQFTKLGPTLGFVACSIVSFTALSKSLSGIPLGTAYAVWTGIGAFGTAAMGIVLFGEPAGALRLFFLFALIGSVIGLKFVS